MRIILIKAKVMKEKNSYIGGLIHGVTSLLTGMKTTMTVFCRRKTTEQYPENRPAAAKVYTDYRQPFLDTIEGALTKELLIRDEDVQVIHGFDSMEHAKAYLETDLFKNDVFVGLKPTWAADPDVRFYEVA